MGGGITDVGREGPQMLGMMMVERDRGWGRRGTTKGGNGRGKSSRIEGMVGYMDREWTVYGGDDGEEGAWMGREKDRI